MKRNFLPLKDYETESSSCVEDYIRYVYYVEERPSVKRALPEAAHAWLSPRVGPSSRNTLYLGPSTK
jgi:hypothetical protein